MFTNTPVGTRRQKAPRARPRISGADQPAAPLPSFPGVPSYSYGSPDTALPNIMSLAETNIHITAAINNAAKIAAERERVVESTPKRRSNRATPEQISRRKTSLRSASKPGSAVSDLDIAERRAEFTQYLRPSPARSRRTSLPPNDYAEEQALYEQLVDQNIDDSFKETEYGEDTREHYPTHLDTFPVNPPIKAKIFNFLSFWLDFSLRITNSTSFFVRNKLWAFLKNCLIWPLSILSSMKSAVWALSVVALAYFLLHSSYLPSFSRKKWTPPILPPTSTDEVVSRIMSLEKVIGRHATLYDDIFTKNNAHSKDIQNTHKDVKQIHETIASLADALKSLTGRISGFETVLKNQESKSTLRIEKSLKTINDKISSFQSRLGNVDNISQMHSQLHSLQKDLEQIQTEMKHLSSGQFIQQQALNIIEEHLPPQLAVKIDPKTRKLDIAPEFWSHLQSLFPNHQEIESKINERFNVDYTAKLPTWDEYIKNNEHAIKQMIQTSHVELLKKANDEGMIISKAVFMDILSKRMEETQSSFHSVLSNLQKHLDETPKLSELTTAAVENLVQSAISKYTSDTVAKIDYALYTAGGRVNPFLTSPTWRTRPRNLVEKLLSPIVDLSHHGHPPAIAIDSDNAPGQCWAMPGQFGFLGLRLSETIYVSDITVDHIHPDVAPHIESAPREMEFWVQVDDLNTRLQIKEITGDEQDVPFGKWGGKYVKISSFTYDIQKGLASQTFAIPLSIKHLNVPVRDVIFRVLSNWGLEKYTCLYRVRVHGVVVPSDVELDDVQAIGNDQEI